MEFKAVIIEPLIGKPTVTVIADHAVNRFIKDAKDIARIGDHVWVSNIRPHWSARITTPMTPAEGDCKGGEW